MNGDTLSFGEPMWFWSLALLPVLAALFFQNERRRAQLVRRLVAARLHERLAGTVSVARRRWRFGLLLLGMGCVALALAKPRYGFTWEETKRKGRDVIIAIDTSRSMLATDLAPNRLTRAKLAAQDLISQLHGDRVGLIAFAGGAFLQAPLTIDYSAVLGALNELDTEIIPQGGTNIAAALKAATEAFGKGESDHRALIIFTDGEDLEAAGEKAAAQLKGAVRIFTVGLGSPEGSLIPVPNGRGGDFVKDSSGQIVKSKLDETMLGSIANATGGFYLRLQNGQADTARIVREGLGQMTEQDIDAKLSRQAIERYQWPLSAGLLLLAASMCIGERRGPAGRSLLKGAPAKAAALALILGLLNSEAPAKNSGIEAYEREDYKGAAKEFSEQLKLQPKSSELHFNLGSAAFKSGDLEQAVKSFSEALTSKDPKIRGKAEYNLGNTLYKRGAAQKDKAPKVQDLKNALQHFDQALQTEPGNENAKYNRDLTKKLLAELEKEPPKEDEKKDKDKEKKDDKDKQDQKEKQDKKDDQKKDGKDDKQEGKDQKDQQKKDEEGKDSKPQDGKEDKEGKDGKPQDSKEGDEKKDEPKPGEGKDGKDAEKKDGQDGKDAEPMPAENEKKPEGELKGTGQPQDSKEPTEAEQQAAEQQAAEKGEMTEQQARNLLESLKGEDKRVPLMERRAKGRPLRDW